MKNKIILIFAVIVVAALSFYGGTLYGKSNNQTTQSSERFSGIPSGGQQQRTGQRDAFPGGDNAITGEIITKDDKSITVKLQDARLPDGQGGSKIIFFSDSTKITKSTAASLNDLEIGKTVFVGGTQNSDGSVTAQTIQIRPLTP